MKKQLKADASLLFVTFIWGSTFVLTKKALQDIPPYTFLAIRFTIAFLFLSGLFIRNYKNINKQAIYYSFMISLSMFGGYALQTIGLQYTTASKSGFLTGLCVVLVPLISMIFMKKQSQMAAIIGVILATIGLFLMTLTDTLSINIGDLYSFLCAISFAIFILQVDVYTPKTDSVLLAILQIGFVALFSSIFSGIFELSKYSSIHFSANVWIALGITGIFATAVAFLIQNVVQNYTSPTHTALIFSAEPVFSAIFAYFLLEEILPLRGIWGGALILAGTLLPEFNFLSFRKFTSLNFAKSNFKN